MTTKTTNKATKKPRPYRQSAADKREQLRLEAARKVQWMNRMAKIDKWAGKSW